MCRLTFYLGPTMAISSIVTEPSNSLIHQSFQSEEREEPLNGDGFGVAWYPQPPDVEPGLFRALTPAWNNSNLHSLARVTRSACILAHVRAATQVRSVSETDCHPFVAGRFALMHNGDLGSFPAIRRRLLASLGDESFAVIQGHTDSEHLFALFLDEVGGQEADPGPEELALALDAAMRRALEFSRSEGTEHSYLNLAVTDGRSAVVTRFTTQPDYAGESLYLNTGRRYLCEGGVCRMSAPDPDGAAVIVSSERLSEEPGWEPVPRNHRVLIRPDRTTHLQPIEL